MASMRDCRGCSAQGTMLPQGACRKVPRSIYEEARDVARATAKTEAFERSRRDRKRVEMCLHISSAFWGLGVCDCVDRAAPSTSCTSIIRLHHCTPSGGFSASGSTQPVPRIAGPAGDVGTTGNSLRGLMIAAARAAYLRPHQAD